MPRTTQKNNQDFEHIGRLMASIYESGYISRSRIYRMSFVKGIMAGFGGVIGATIIVTLLLWVLSLFDSISFVDSIRETIQEGGR